MKGAPPLVWTDKENERLINMVQKYGSDNWYQISMNFNDKSSYDCSNQWKHLDKELKKGKWTHQEDLNLSIGVKVYGKGNWSVIATAVPHRNEV